MFGNLAATINFTEEISLFLGCGLDLNNDFRTQQKPKGAKTYINGMYKEQTVFDSAMTNDFLLLRELELKKGEKAVVEME